MLSSIRRESVNPYTQTDLHWNKGFIGCSIRYLFTGSKSVEADFGLHLELSMAWANLGACNHQIGRFGAMQTSMVRTSVLIGLNNRTLVLVLSNWTMTSN